MNVTEGGPSSKPALIGTCPGVEVEVNGKLIKCLLDTGSQVTLFSETLFKSQLQETVLNTIDESNLLTLKAANGLQIPYIGYVMMDFKVGGVCIPNKGEIIVEDQCLGSDRAVLGMNVITQCWKELMQGIHPGVVAFWAAVAPTEGNLWEKAFAVCRRIQQKGPTALGHGVAKLTKQTSVVIPPQTEMVLWCRMSDEVPRDNCTVLIEPLVDEESSWRTARTIAVVHDGHLPLRLCNPTMFLVEVHHRRPLAEVTPTAT